jgi:spore maturation protein CgeB
MNIALFYHTLVSDWNHGNAHFLRGVASELIARGHEVRIFEPKNSWSRLNLVAEYGEKPIKMFREAYPALESIAYDIQLIDLDRALEGTDLVIVHEWNDHALVQRIGEHRRKSAYKLLFHDTHHRTITDRQSMDAYDLSHYDGVLAYGQVLADIYRETGRVRRVWTWHEAADTRVFKPLPRKTKRVTLSGSATGATTNARRNSTNF